METRKCFSFTWILENFAYCILEKAEALESPTFIADTLEKTKWCLRIYPRNIIDENNISFYLRREEDSKGPNKIEIDYELAFLASDGSVLKSSNFQGQIFKRNKSFGEPSFETRKNVFVKNRFKFLPGGTLMARCRIWKSNSEVKEHGQCFARTRFATERRCFLWKTEKFSTLQCEKEILQIRSVSSDTAILNLDLSIQQDLTKKEEILCLLVSSALETATFFTLEVSILDSKAIPIDCGEYEILLNNLSQKEINLPLSKDFLTSNSPMFLPNDTLTLLFNSAFSTGVISQGIESISYGMRSECAIPVPAKDALFQHAAVPDVEETGDSLITSTSANEEIQTLKQDIICMLKENIQCDVKLSVGSETFPAHWFILSARSPVFRAMFKSDMKEKTKDRIDIEDLPPDTIRRLLLYMYTDTLEELQWETACDLYTAADKYEILALKDRCCNFLKANLSLSNACQVLVLADLHQDKDLKSTVQDFILKRDVDVINSGEWKVLMETNAHLAAQTMFLKFKK